MSIFSSTNPLDWAALDGIYIDDTAPPPSVQGVAAGTVILVGQFERGSAQLQGVGNVRALYEDYGNNISYSGLVALQNMKFGLLNIVRVVAANAVKGTKTFQFAGGPTNIITFTALWFGVYGNNLQVTIAAGTTQGSKYTIHDANVNAVFPDEVYDNVLISAVGNTFANSNLITATVLSTANEPTPAAATNLLLGSDGVIANTDYQTAITTQCQTFGAGNILVLDAYNATRNGYLVASMAATTDKMAILAGQPADSRATAVTDVANYRDTDGRLIYAYPYVYTSIAGTLTLVPPAAFYASVLSQTSPSIDPAYASNAQYLTGIASLGNANLQRSDYIALKAAGISAFEKDQDLGIKIKSGVVTQIVNSQKSRVYRRRMADYINFSLAKYLKNYQNAPNSSSNAIDIAAAFSAFNRLLEGPAGGTGIVPKDSEVGGGKASVIDIKSLNTDDSIANGQFFVIYRRRIYSSMEEIVLQTEIGTGVVVTEANS